MKKTVTVNQKQSEAIGKIVKKYQLRASYYQKEILTFQASKEIKARAYLYSSAICHQTHSLINEKLNLKGWDYLSYIFVELAKKNDSLLDSQILASFKKQEVADKLKTIFSDENSKNCTLDRLLERADFLIQTGTFLNEKFNGKISNLIKESDGFLLNQGNGLYESLEKILPFSDKLRKKSTVFVKLLEESGIVKIKDPESFIPMMDYHQQRVILRTGCVEIIDPKLKRKLINQEEIKSDKIIREACIEASKIISKISGFTTANLDNFFWSLGRSCCRKNILCSSGECDKEPCTFEAFFDMPSHNKCVFEKICKGNQYKQYRNLWQPIVKTHYY